MVEVMHVVLLEATKATFVDAPFIAVNVDEITTIDNTQWLSIHLYVVQKWRRIPILLCVEAVSLSATSDNVFSLMVRCILDFGGLRVEELVGKLVNIGCDEFSVFRGHRTCMTTQFKNKIVPFIIGGRWFAHQNNMVSITLSNVLLMHRLEGILQSMYVLLLSQFEKICKIPEAYKSSQHQGQQDFTKCQD